jgi:hypothetical protein
MGKTNFLYRGARASIILHEQELMQFRDCWLHFSNSGYKLPPSKDPDCESLTSMMSHVLWAARGYMIWICDKLDLPDPQIEMTPDENLILISHDGKGIASVDKYLQHLIERWRLPLQNVAEERYYLEEFKSSWKVTYCIDAMLEHAVMHPRRHRFQLEELMTPTD